MIPNNNALNFGTITVPSLTPLANTNQASLALWADKIVRASFQLVTSGTAAGTIQIQGSNDYAVGAFPNQFQPTNWNNLLATAVSVSGAGTYLVPEVEMSYEYLRLVYTDSSGGTATGTIGARMKSMGL